MFKHTGDCVAYAGGFQERSAAQAWVTPCSEREHASSPSLDPLGPISVILRGSQTKKIYPLAILCLHSGASHIELMEGLEAKDVYLALTRLELRFGIKIVQIFSDSGTQLSPSLLGEECVPTEVGEIMGSYQQHSLLAI